MTSTDQVSIFAELPYQIMLKEFEKTGLDVIFFGQEHVDTMAIMQDKSQPDSNKIRELMSDQKLFSNKDLLDKNFSEVIKNLDECEKYVQGVLVSFDSDLSSMLTFTFRMEKLMEIQTQAA